MIGIMGDISFKIICLWDVCWRKPILLPEFIRRRSCIFWVSLIVDSLCPLRHKVIIFSVVFGTPIPGHKCEWHAMTILVYRLVSWKSINKHVLIVLNAIISRSRKTKILILVRCMYSVQNYFILDINVYWNVWFIINILILCYLFICRQWLNCIYCLIFRGWIFVVVT